MRSDNLQLLCVQPPTSSYNFQLPHGRLCHHGRHGHGGLGGQVGHAGHGGRGEHGGHGGHGGQDRTGRDRTGRDRHLNLTFQVTCDWQLSKFPRCLLLCMLN